MFNLFERFVNILGPVFQFFHLFSLDFTDFLLLDHPLMFLFIVLIICMTARRQTVAAFTLVGISRWLIKKNNRLVNTY